MKDKWELDKASCCEGRKQGAVCRPKEGFLEGTLEVEVSLGGRGWAIALNKKSKHYATGDSDRRTLSSSRVIGWVLSLRLSCRA